MKNIDLSKYGITGTTEVVYNPSFEMLFGRRPSPVWKVMKRARSASWEPSTS